MDEHTPSSDDAAFVRRSVPRVANAVACLPASHAPNWLPVSSARWMTCQFFAGCCWETVDSAKLEYYRRQPSPQ